MPKRLCRRASALSNPSFGTVAAVGRKQKERHMSIFNRILCPIDFDGNSLDALRLARRIAERDKATLSGLHVVPPQDPLVRSPPGVLKRDEYRARTDLQKVSKPALMGQSHAA